jgi:hypothetical protein
MSNGAYAGLRLAARAAKPDPEADPNETEPDNDEDDQSEPKSKKKCKDKNPMDENCEDKASFAAGFAAANDRFNAVLASENYAGNTALAHTLLGNDKLSADEILTVLAAASPPAPAAAAASDVDAEEAARAEMQAALADNANSNIDAGSTPVVPTSDAASIWDQAYANCNFKSA